MTISDKYLIAVHKYMDLRIKGIGVGPTEEETRLLQNMTKDEDDALFIAISELGGSLPDGLTVPKNPSFESRMLSKIFAGLWLHGHEWAVNHVADLIRGLGDSEDQEGNS